MKHLERRLRNLELLRRKETLDAEPEGHSPQILLEKLRAMSQRFQAARDRGEDVPCANPGEVKEQLHALLEGYTNEKLPSGTAREIPR